MSLRNAFDDDDQRVTMQFLRRHFPKIVATFFLLFIYIELRYDYEQAASDLVDLKDTLTDARYVNIQEWGRLTSRNRPEAIRRHVGESDAELANSDEPPYRVD